MTLGLVPVSVSHQVIGYLRRRLSGEVIDFVELDMPRHRLETTAAMYTVTPEALQDNGISAPRIPGSLHAAEHAAIGLLPLVASCDRGDIGGLSTAIGEGACPRCSSTTDIRRCRLRRTRLPAGEHLARRHRSSDRGVRMPAGLPSCAVTQMRERERSPGQAGAIRVLTLVLNELAAAKGEPRAPTDPSNGRPPNAASPEPRCCDSPRLLEAKNPQWQNCGRPRSDNTIRAQARQVGRSGKLPAPRAPKQGIAHRCAGGIPVTCGLRTEAAAPRGDRR